MLLGQPVMIMLVRAHILGLLTKACWNASFLPGDRQAWWMAMSSGMSGPGHGLNQVMLPSSLFNMSSLLFVI